MSYLAKTCNKDVRGPCSQTIALSWSIEKKEQKLYLLRNPVYVDNNFNTGLGIPSVETAEISFLSEHHGLHVK